MSTETSRSRSERLLRAYDAGDPGALIEALLAAVYDPSGPSNPHERISAERWVLGTALAYVCHVAGFPMGDAVKLPKRGSMGRWSRRIAVEIRDLTIYRNVAEARSGGMSLEQAIAAVANLPEHEEAVRTACKRARRRLSADPRRYELWDRLAPVMVRFQPGRVIA